MMTMCLRFAFVGWSGGGKPSVLVRGAQSEITQKKKKNMKNDERTRPATPTPAWPKLESPRRLLSAHSFLGQPALPNNPLIYC